MARRQRMPRPGGRLYEVVAVIALAAIPAAATPTVGTHAGGADALAPLRRPSAPVHRSDGRALYQQQCASCHGLSGEGTARGPSLHGVGPASTDFQLRTGRMPLRGDRYEPRRHKTTLSSPDIDALVGYVSGFGGGGPAIPAVRPGQVGTGRALYATHCAACHSTAGVGAALSNGEIAPSLLLASPTQVGEAVRVGPGLMPAFPEGLLSAKELNAIAGYVRVLQNRDGDLDRGGTSLGRVGPVTEGLVTWLVAMTALLLAVRWMGSRAGE